MTKLCHDGEFLLQHFFDKCYQNYCETKKYHSISCKVKIQGVKEPGKSFTRSQFCFGRWQDWTYDKIFCDALEIAW